jgi:hypothetical protein
MRYSTSKELFDELRSRFSDIVTQNGLSAKKVEIHAAVLTPEEAIGTPGRTDYPILEGKDMMLQAVYENCKGQVFTDSPASFTGTLQDILSMDIVNDRHARGLFIAALNAVMRSLGAAVGTVHCKNDGMETCAVQMGERISKQYSRPNIAQIGYQPAILEQLAQKFPLRVLDMNPKNIGTTVNGITIEDGRNWRAAAAWAGLILCTGSTLANGTIIHFLNLDKDVVFYGTTIAGAAELLGLKRLCFESL